MKLRITVGQVELQADLFENQTAKAIYEILPFDASYNTWGEEFYFSIPLHLDLENGQEIVEIGDIAYWPPGNAFCIFFGRTPASENGEPRAASEVTVFGKIREGVEQLKTVDSSTIKVEAMAE